MTFPDDMKVGDVACCCGWQRHVEEPEVLPAMREHVRKCHTTPGAPASSASDRGTLLAVVKEIAHKYGGTVQEL